MAQPASDFDSSAPPALMWTGFEPKYITYSVLIAIAFLSLSLFCKSLRYGFARRLVVNSFCWIQGRRPIWVEDPGLAHLILQSSASKGNCIEQLISLYQFHPILSLESVDGEQWRRMKKAFLVLRTHLPPLQLLHSIIDEAVGRCLSSDLIIDCPALVQLIFDIMLKWLFDRDMEPGDSSIILEGVEECRKALSIKGEADPVAKTRLIEWMKRTIRGSKYVDVFRESWKEPEYWSLLLQPFFISPAINLVDLAVTLDSEPFKRRLQLGGGGLGPIILDRATIVDAINFSHPFPVLERWFPDGLRLQSHSDYKRQGEGHKFLIKPGTHVFLPMDEIGRRLCSDDYSKQYEYIDGNKNYYSSDSASAGAGAYQTQTQTHDQWAAFGAGKRACAGQDIAFVLAAQLFSPLLTHNADVIRSGKPESRRFRPSEGKTFSGRENDLRETFGQNCFQVKLLILITCKLVMKRLMAALYPK